MATKLGTGKGRLVPKAFVGGGIGTVTPYASGPQFQTLVAEAMGKITKQLVEVCKAAKVFTPEVLEYAMEPTFEKSQKYCPVKTGALVESAFMEVRQEMGGERLVIGYAPEGDPYYAIYVHEQVEYFHPLPTRSKFLTTAVNEDLHQIQERLVEGYRNLLGLEGG